MNRQAYSVPSDYWYNLRQTGDAVILTQPRVQNGTLKDTQRALKRIQRLAKARGLKKLSPVYFNQRCYYVYAKC